MAENKPQTSTEAPPTFKHLSHCGSKACTSMQEKSLFSDCSHELTACFCYKLLAASHFLRVPKRWKSLGSVLPTRLVTGYGDVAESHGPPSVQH